jgi:hypothetical protein
MEARLKCDLCEPCILSVAPRSPAPCYSINVWPGGDCLFGAPSKSAPGARAPLAPPKSRPWSYVTVYKLAVISKSRYIFFLTFAILPTEETSSHMAVRHYIPHSLVFVFCLPAKNSFYSHIDVLCSTAVRWICCQFCPESVGICVKSFKPYLSSDRLNASITEKYSQNNIKPRLK